MSLGKESPPEDFQRVYVASPLDVKQGDTLTQRTLCQPFNHLCRSGLPHFSCICGKGSTGFRCHPPGLPRGEVWVTLHSVPTGTPRKGLYRGTCLRCTCLCLRWISSNLPGSPDSQGKGNVTVPGGMTGKSHSAACWKHLLEGICSPCLFV